MAKDKSEKKKEKKTKEVTETVEESIEVNEDVDMGDAELVKVCCIRLREGRIEQVSKVTSKAKKEKEEITIPLEDLSPIAQPLAQKKLLKKLHKTIKKGARS